MISAGVLHRLPSERATEPFALLRVLPQRRFIARYAGLRLFFLKPDSASSAKLAYQWTDLDETWVVASHRVPNMSAMLRLPWQQPLPSNGTLYIQQLFVSGGRTREPILMKFGIQQQIRTK